MKSHLRGVKLVLYSYIMGVFLSWASYPVLIHFTFIVPLEISQSIYTIIATIALLIFLYLTLYDFGEKDRRPFIKEAYEGKGFVCGAIGFLIIVLAEVLIIALANKYVLVRHPHLVISNVNNYIRLILYMPFYWLYQLLDPMAGVVPRVEYLTSLVPGVLLIPVSGFGYLRGLSGKKIFNKSLDEIKKKFVYKGDK